jgi:3-hydroxy-9,10-secoandrosta-1,3,5(10)-triene-9,17-dione monooxygenase reductase component
MAAMDQHVPAPAPVDRASFRAALGRFVTGVTVVTSLDPAGKPVGLTVNSFNSVSLDPPLVLWSIDRRGTFFDAFAQAPRFAVNVLSAAQKDLARRFAGNPAGRFQGVACEPGLAGIPLLTDCIAWFECSTRQRVDGGDHLILVGLVERFAQGPGQELLYFAGSYGAARAL